MRTAEKILHVDCWQTQKQQRRRLVAVSCPFHWAHQHQQDLRRPVGTQDALIRWIVWHRCQGSVVTRGQISFIHISSANILISVSIFFSDARLKAAALATQLCEDGTASSGLICILMRVTSRKIEVGGSITYAQTHPGGADAAWRVRGHTNRARGDTRYQQRAPSDLFPWGVHSVFQLH